MDYAKLADVAGFKNANTACTNFSRIKKKVLAASASDLAAAAGNNSKSSRKTVFTAINHNDDEPGDNDTPTNAKAAPKKRASKAKVKVDLAEAGDIADNELTSDAESPKIKVEGSKGKGKIFNHLMLNSHLTTLPAAAAFATADADAMVGILENAPTKPKRKRAASNPKDTNAPHAKRAKKGAKTDTASNVAFGVNADEAVAIATAATAQLGRLAPYQST